MKTIGKVELERKIVNGKNGEKKVYNLIVKAYDHEGQCREGAIFCRLTEEMANFVESEMIFDRIGVEIDESFYSVDIYKKGEEVYTKPTLVVTALHIVG